ncbi:immunoglobulin domain-containing protein [Vibrio owensii]|uniref:immunoglobulin domain-containing protein n=1 Tax=Vibrio owensii TaxID=696485 RepID=UPI003AAED2C9
MSWSCLKSGSEVSTGDGLVATYSIANAQFSNAGLFSFVFTNAYGQATSDEVRVTVVRAPVPPTVEISPNNQDLLEGDTLALYSRASGDEPMSWSYQKDSIEVLSGTGLIAEFNKENITVDDAGSYTCVFTNAEGSDTSNPATVNIVPAVTNVEIFNDSGVTTLYPDDTVMLRAVVTYSDGSTIDSSDDNSVVFWGTSDSSVALVFQHGLVQAWGKGNVSITATASDVDLQRENLVDSTDLVIEFKDDVYFNITPEYDGTNDIIGYSEGSNLGAVNSGLFPDNSALKFCWFRGGANQYYGVAFSSMARSKFFNLNSLYLRWIFDHDGSVFDSQQCDWGTSSYVDPIRYRDYSEFWQALQQRIGQSFDVYVMENNQPTELIDSEPLYDHTFLYDGE